MRAVVTRAGSLRGTARVPGDKSIAHRAVLFGALARGTTRLRGARAGRTLEPSLEAARRLGAAVRQGPGGTEIESPGRPAWNARPGTLDCRGSATTARLLLGMLAAARGADAVLDGDDTLRRRPMGRVAGPLASVGADVDLSPGGTLPARVRGRALNGATHRLKAASAQVKTALLLAGLGADEATEVVEAYPTRDHTERLLPRFGARLARTGEGVRVEPGELSGADVHVPGDASAATVLAVAAALVPGARVEIEDAGANPTRTRALDVLRRMGARVRVDAERDDGEPAGRWTCEDGAARPVVLAGDEIPLLVDELPVLAVAAACCAGTSEIRDAAELRVKESDRLARVAAGLRAMGAAVEERPDGLLVEGGRPLHGAVLDVADDHRLAMAFAVAGLVADGETVLTGAESAEVSFPGFFEALAALTGGAARLARG